MVEALIPFLGKLSLRPRPYVPTKMFQPSSSSSPNANPPPPANFGPGAPGQTEIDDDRMYVQETRNGKIAYLLGGEPMKLWDPNTNTMSFVVNGTLKIKCTLDWINNQWTPAIYEYFGTPTDPTTGKRAEVYDVNTGALLLTIDSVPGENWVWKYSPIEKKTFLHKHVMEGRTKKTVKFDASDLYNPLTKTWVSGNGEKAMIHTLHYHPGTNRKDREERETNASVMTDVYAYDIRNNKDYITHITHFDKKMRRYEKTTYKTVRNWFADKPNKPPDYEI